VTELADRLYELLPAIYRVRDAENGMPLRALMQVIAGQAAVLQDNIRQLYDDEFIETCAQWVIPYIGDLLGATPVYQVGSATSRRRAEVANTIGYRRRKGTLLGLDQVAADVSGRPALAVEFFKRLITTESMRHVRPKHEANVNLRAGSRLDRLAGPFDTLNRTVEVRRIAPRIRPATDPDAAPCDVALHGGGKYNIPDIGICLWRWKPDQALNAPAFQVDGRRYLFSPIGHDMPLFNLPAPRASFSGLTTRLDVPQPISRREFFDDPAAFYGPSIQLIADGNPVPVSQICCRDLSDQAGAWACVPKGKIGIDPVLGRIRFAPNLSAPRSLRLNYVYAFPADIGGGPYDRTPNLPVFTPEAFPFRATLGTAATPTFESAIAAWNATKPGAKGVIVAPDFETFSATLTINVPATSALWILSAKPGASPIPSGSRVVLRGNIEVRGGGSLFLNGLWISGSVRISGTANVQFSDCTLVPGIALTRSGLPLQPGEPSIVAPVPGATIVLIRCISGPIAIAEGGSARICSSIVDACSRCSVAFAGADLTAEGADLHVEDSTIVGKVRVRTLELASNTIFLAHRPKHDPFRAALWCSRKQAGCVRFCFLPGDAITPRRYRCLPGDAALEAIFRPHFVSLRYGNPSYALLSGDTPLAVWTGSDNGSQMGVYHSLQETEAARNVQLRAPEFLPFNLEAGVFLEPSTSIIVPRTPAGYGYGRVADPCAETADDELWRMGIGAHLL
jgi:hypothetical protein